jgi:alpha-tubulin suppressor-like RCC1 family protein
VGEGSAVITVATQDGNKTARCAVAVLNSAAVAGVSLDKSEMTLKKVGDQGQLAATVRPSSATNRAVAWSSSDSSVAVVSGSGLVTGAKVGTAVITVATQDGNHRAECAVTVAPGVSLNKTAMTLYKEGSQEQLTATVKPDNATNKAVTWASSDSSVATVSSGGLVTAISAGAAVITVTTQEGNYMAKCTVTVAMPPSVPVVAISAAQHHTCAIRADGTLWAWGSNDFGQLGLGDTTKRTSPVQIGTANDWASVSASFCYTMAIKVDGTLWAWGGNGAALGDGTTTKRTSPVQIGTENDWKAVSAGNTHTMAIKADGTLWAWGNNSRGQLGDGKSILFNPYLNPIQIGTENDWVAVFAGSYHTMALKTDGSLWAWGSNAGDTSAPEGRLGLGDTKDRKVPTRVGTANDWVAVFSGSYHTMALKSDGSIWGWGGNYQGQLGLGDTTNRTSPVQIGTENDWKAVSAGGNHTMAIKSNGSLWAWGHNVYGGLGLGDTTDRNIPVRVGTDNDWASISAGYLYTMALKTDGSLWAWGWNTDVVGMGAEVGMGGQLGLGDTKDRKVPTLVGVGVWH